MTTQGMMTAGEGAPAAAVAVVPSVTLGAYLAAVGQAACRALPRAWVEAEILAAKAVRNGLSLELVEPGASREKHGQLRAMLWTRTALRIADDLGLSDGEALTAAALQGRKVRILLETRWDARWHLGAEVLDLDLDIKASLVAANRDRIRAMLREQGLHEAQRRLPTPLDVTTVAVIHPPHAAGWADVERDLSRLAARGIVTYRSHPAPFEGRYAAVEVAKAIAAAQRSGPDGQRADVILMVRGGGAAAGLAALDDLQLVKAIASSPVPIVTGLGHATDRCLADEQAWRACDTPSKAVAMVRSIIRQRCSAVRADHRTILGETRRLVEMQQRPVLAATREALLAAAGWAVACEAARLRGHARGVERRALDVRAGLAVVRAELQHLAAAVLASTPSVPRRAAAALTLLHAGAVRGARARLPGRHLLGVELRRSAGLASALVERQRAEVIAAATAMEQLLRRRLAVGGGRILALGEAVATLGLEATLGRGFALALDGGGRLVRSAAAARAAGGFELRFADGSVPVQAATATDAAADAVPAVRGRRRKGKRTCEPIVADVRSSDAAGHDTPAARVGPSSSPAAPAGVTNSVPAPPGTAPVRIGPI